MPIHKIFFYLFILSFPTQLGRHFWPEWSFVWGLRVDYLAPTLCLSDILLGLTIMVWMLDWNWTNWANWANLTKKAKQFVSTYIYHISICIIVFFFFLFNFRTVSSSPLWFYKLVKLVEFVLLGVYVAKTTKTTADFKRIINLLLIGAVLESGLAIAQFIKQSSIGGVFWWLGERTFNITTPGIAKISLRNPLTYSQTLLLRPYGTFSHPNSLAGYLLVILTILFSRFFQPDGLKNPKPVGFFNSFTSAILLISLFLTFSRSAWLVGLIILVFYLISKASAKLKKSRLTPILLILILYTLYSILHTLIVSDPEGFQKRWQLTLASWQMIKSSPFFGIGLGHFIPKLAEIPQKGQIFWLQPVHNIFILVMAEAGLIGLVIFLGVLGATYRHLVSSIQYPVSRVASLTAILLLGLADHYWLTLQQNQLLFALILGLCWARLNHKS